MFNRILMVNHYLNFFSYDSLNRHNVMEDGLKSVNMDLIMLYLVLEK